MRFVTKLRTLRNGQSVGFQEVKMEYRDLRSLRTRLSQIAGLDRPKQTKRETFTIYVTGTHLD